MRVATRGVVAAPREASPPRSADPTLAVPRVVASVPRYAAVMWATALLVGLSVLLPQAPSASAQDAVANARAAIARWQGAPAAAPLRAAAARAVAAGGRAAVQELAQQLAAARRGADPADCEALAALVPAVAVEVLRRELTTGFFFVGQYRELRPLQPEVGTYFLELLLAPPDWLPRADRATLMPVLRDLYEQSPGPQTLARLRGLVAEEPDDARLDFAVACALAQWGESDLADARRRELEARAGTGKLADRLDAQQQLARLHYELRDMGRAAELQLACVKTADERGHVLAPTAYYNAACFLCLAGREADALQVLERCLEVQRSTHAALRVARSLFELDPELAAIRNTERFRELLRRAAAY